MTKLKKTIVTKTVTEEIEIVPAEAGEERGHRYMTVGGYGEYKDIDGSKVLKPQINLF